MNQGDTLEKAYIYRDKFTVNLKGMVKYQNFNICVGLWVVDIIVNKQKGDTAQNA